MAIDSQGNGVQNIDGDEADQEQFEDDQEEEQAVQFRGGPDMAHVSRMVIERHVPTDGCPACTSIIIKGTTSGRVGINHHVQCRNRVIQK